MKKRPSRFVGIDVSKDDLDLACRPEDTRWRMANDNAGIAQCLAQLRQLKPTLIVLEATGRWQGSLVVALAVSQLPFAVMNPCHIRDFAKATGELAKTDALDAGLISHFAEAVLQGDAGKPPCQSLTSACKQLHQHSTMHDQRV